MKTAKAAKYMKAMKAIESAMKPVMIMKTMKANGFVPVPYTQVGTTSDPNKEGQEVSRSRNQGGDEPSRPCH